MPKTIFTNFGEHTYDIVDAVGGPPVVIKVTEGTQGLGVYLAEDYYSAHSLLEAHNDLQSRVIVQEFIEEAKGSDLRIFIVGDTIVGSMKRQASEGEFRSNMHRGATALSVSLTPQEKALALTVAKVLGLNVCGVDLIQSKRGPLLLEVNSSPGLEGIENATRKNIARDIIKYIEKNAK
ncbi:probable alpha-L-glutamate ligase [Liolophura sinensis]|uniref:probable alpha-L-glutamate ligase n=1 Tax=Liolophura sinensis TaxID=3198878 RepID=UPI0031590E9C